MRLSHTTAATIITADFSSSSFTVDAPPPMDIPATPGAATAPTPVSASLPESKTTPRLERAPSADQAVDSCVICLDPVTQVCQLSPCGHRNFDFDCVHPWLVAKARCPICKSPTSLATCFSPDGPRSTKYSLRPPHSSYPPPRSQPRPASRRALSPEPPGLHFRRQVYRRLRYSMHVGSNPHSRYRELAPLRFRIDSQLQSRARLFLRRELRVFSFLTTGQMPSRRHSSQANNGPRGRTCVTIEKLCSHILLLLTFFDIRGSDGGMEEILRPFLGAENTKLFLHELEAFLRSPYTSLEEWDSAVQYADDDSVASPATAVEGPADATTISGVITPPRSPAASENGCRHLRRPSRPWAGSRPVRSGSRKGRHRFAPYIAANLGPR